MAVYGIFDWAYLGSFSATFTLDGSPKSDLYTVNASSPEYVNKVGQILNFPFFHSGVITSGKHTLLVNITHCVNQSFVLDYITYSPSFNTILQVPNYTTVSTTTLPTDPGRTDRDVGPTGTSVGDQDKRSSPSVSAIIGVCIGSLLFVAFGCALLYLLWRRSVNVKVRRSRDHDACTLGSQFPYSWAHIFCSRGSLKAAHAEQFTQKHPSESTLFHVAQKCISLPIFPTSHASSTFFCR